MIISINQPAYLPWPGYFDRMACADVHVILDHVQFEKGSLVNRNEVRAPGGKDRCWLTIPVNAHGRPTIDKVKIVDDRWHKRHEATLTQSYGKAAFWPLLVPALRSMYAIPYVRLIEVIRETNLMLQTVLRISTPTLRSSTLELTSKKSELILDICKILNATVYLSGPIGKDYLDHAAFEEVGIEIRTHRWSTPTYDQGGEPTFETSLSVVDALANLGPRGTAELMEEGRRIE